MECHPELTDIVGRILIDKLIIANNTSYFTINAQNRFDKNSMKEKFIFKIYIRLCLCYVSILRYLKIFPKL